MSESKTDVLTLAWKSALSGGIPGMAAMGVQVSTLMWLRTTMNHQYKYGTTMRQSMKQLYAQGGIPRFYSGYTLAMIQGPLSRFGDTAANMGMLALINAHEETRDLPIAVKTLAASMSAAIFRVGLMPVDTVKTMLQVEGTAKGFPLMYEKIRGGGPGVLYHGATASAMATLVGHYPWYTTYNYLNYLLPEYNDKLGTKLCRNAFIGFCASLVSDTMSNSLRVIKTARQTSDKSKGYTVIVRDILEKDGMRGLLGRGLKTRILTNCMQGIMFSVLWKLGQEYYIKRQATAEKQQACEHA